MRIFLLHSGKQIAVDIVNFVIQKRPGLRLRTLLSSVLSKPTAGLRLSAAGHLVHRIATGVGIVKDFVTGSAVASHSQRVGIDTTPIWTGDLARPSLAVGIASLRQFLNGTGRGLQDAAVRLANKTSGTIAKPIKAAGVALANRPSGTAARSQTQDPAVNIVQITYDLVRQNWSGAATQVAYQGRSDWTNLSDATGAPDSVIARLTAVSAVQSGSGELRLHFPDPTNKGALNIDKVELRLNWVTSNAVTTSGEEASIYWFDGVTERHLYTLPPDQNHTPLGAPHVFDITADVSAWWQLQSCQLRIRGFCPAAAALPFTIDVDACELYIEASLTENL